MGELIDMGSLYINGKDIKNSGAHLLQDYVIGGTELDSEYFQGKNRSTFKLLGQAAKLKSLTFSLEFSGRTRREIMLAKSHIDAALTQKTVDLTFPDGLMYLCVLTQLGKITLQGVDGKYVVGAAEYEAIGMCHDPMVTKTGRTIDCESTVPLTDCIIDCDMSVDREEVRIAGVYLSGLKAGQHVRIDGIDKRVLINGVPVSGAMRFISFPSLTPGINTFSSPEPLTVSYYPTYI